MPLNTAKHTAIITKMKATLGNVDSVKQVIAHPFKGNPDSFPAVIFFPDNFENSFDSVSENFKIYAFKMYAIVSTESYTDEEVFEEILPKVVDEILEQFDNDWDMGTVDGHRMWALVNTGIWGKSSEDKAQTAWCEMNVMIKVVTNN